MLKKSVTRSYNKLTEFIKKKNQTFFSLKYKTNSMRVKASVESSRVYKIYGNISHVNIFFKRKHDHRRQKYSKLGHDTYNYRIFAFE